MAHATPELRLRRTRIFISSQFLVNLLRKYCAVEFLWDESWKGGKAIQLEDILHEYDAFVFHQISAEAKVPYYKLPANITFIPMLDSFGNEELLHYNRRLWRKYAGVKVLNFSKYLHIAALSHGLASKHVMYYPCPDSVPMKEILSTDQLTGFFWQRRPDCINWDTVKKLIEEARFKSIHIHMAVDPGLNQYRPSDADRANFRLSFSDWFERREDYYQAILRESVYFAPRECEGIGMSFLEAMAMGRCVVAPNFGTMNEYILNGYNGLLYDLANPHPLDFSKVREIGKRARESVEVGYQQWMNMEKEIVDFILTPRDEVYKRFYSGGINYVDLAVEQRIQSTKSPSTFTKLKRRIGNSKARPFLLPIWNFVRRIIKGVKQ